MSVDLAPYRELYPFESRWLDRGGARLHYLDEGAGAPETVVMVHGNPSWSFLYRDLVRAGRGRIRAIVPDHMGMGLSDKPGDDAYGYTLANRVDDLEALLDAAGVDGPVSLVLHDWGGMIGMAWAARHVDRVKRIVALNTAAFRLPDTKPFPLPLRLVRDTPLGALLVRGANAFAETASRTCTVRPLPDLVRRGFVAPYGSWDDRIATLRFVEDIPLAPGDPAWDLVAEVEAALPRFAAVPMLFGWGERDWVFDRHFLAEWVRRFPHAEVHSFADAGHYVLEDKGDVLIPRILDFLEGKYGVTVLAPSCNIAARLDAQAAASPDAAAVIHRGETLTFGGLRRRCDAHAHRLAAIGVGRGTRTVLMVKPGFDFFALTFALFKLGAVPVLVDPGMGVKNLGRCLAEAAPEVFVGIPMAHFARVVAGWGKATLRRHVTVGGGFFRTDRLDALPEPGLPYEAAETAPGDVAAILFTSGSTGVPKGAVYQHATFDAQVAFLRDHFGFGPGDVDLPTFPLFALFDAALGVTAVIPEMDFTRPGSVAPEAILGPIATYGVTQMFGSPALLDAVGRYGARAGTRLPTLRHVISAGAPVPPAVMERFHALLRPEALIHTPYGATEALPVAAITSREVLHDTAAGWARGEGTCVGRPIAGVELAIIGVTDGPLATWSEVELLPAGAVGEIVVRGPIVSRSYVSRPDHDALGKIPDGRGGVWHRMGDLGRMDSEGRLWFQGRKAHRVRTGTGDLHTIPCEAIFNQHPRVRRSALVGVGEPGRQRPVICIELEPGEARHGSKALAAEILALGAMHAHTAGIHDLLFHPAFPVDIRHNAKIFREKLATWAAGRKA